MEKINMNSGGQWSIEKSEDEEPKLKPVPTPVVTPKTKLDTEMQHTDVQDKMKNIIGSVKGIREKVAQLKAKKMADSIEGDLKADKQRSKIKLVKSLNNIIEHLTALSTAL